MATARDLMTPDPSCISPESTMQEAARMMRDLNIGVLPVVGGDGVLGVITDRDLVIRGLAESDDPATAAVGQFATQQALSVEADADERDVMALMAQHQITRVLVTEGEQLVGIISKQNIAQGSDASAVGSTIAEVTEG